MSTLNLKYNVDVIVTLTKLSALRKAFDLMLIMGSSTVINSLERIRTYYSAAEMLEDGWAGTEPEYKAAALAFSQDISPQRLCIGRWSAVAGEINTAAISTAGAGTGYAVGDILTIVQAGGTGATAEVLAVAEGAVSSIKLTSGGSGYTVATGLATTVSPSGGTGCMIDISNVSAIETVVEAAAICRAANSEWYALVVCGQKSNVTNIEDLAEWAESTEPVTLYAFNTDQADIITTASSDIFSTIKAKSYGQTLGMYSTDADAPDCVAGIIGYAMGQMVGSLANSAYTLNFKSITGVVVESLSSTQFGYIVGKNGNAYVNRGEYYNWFQNGTMLNGTYFDERIYLDKLANDIQLNLADLFNQTPKVPQTEDGVTMEIASVTTALEKARKVGFIAPGKWNGQAILNLANGDTLPSGYLVQAEAIDDQSQADRDARKSPPLYVAVKLAGAMHSVIIKVNVNR